MTRDDFVKLLLLMSELGFVLGWTDPNSGVLRPVTFSDLEELRQKISSDGAK